MRRLGDVALALHRVTKPTIAKVDGVAVGAGLSLALGLRPVRVQRAARLSMIFAKRGLSLDNGASWLLPRLVGLARAKEIALFGGMWSGEEAAEIGLVNRAMPVGELDAFVDDWATTLAAGPPLALSMTKTLLHALVARRPWSRPSRTRPAARPSTSRPRTRTRPWPPSPRSETPSSSGGNRLGSCSTASKEWSATPPW